MSGGTAAQAAARASEALSGAAARLAGSAELRAPDAALAEAGDARGAGASRAAADPALAAQAAELLTAWCATVDALLAEAQAAPGEARGPSAILPLAVELESLQPCWEGRALCSVSCGGVRVQGGVGCIAS